MSKQITRREEPNLERPQQMKYITPMVDVYDSDDEVLLVADLPGVTKSELQIRIDEGQLTIEGRREPPAGHTALAHEFDYGTYQRVFRVPQQIDADKVRAELQHGVLELHLPRSAAARPRSIPVKAG